MLSENPTTQSKSSLRTGTEPNPSFPKLRRFIHYITSPFSSSLSHRRLLKDFIVRDIRGRFAGSMAGIFWALINPVVTLIVYLFIFSTVLRVQVSAAETGTDSFLIFFLAGFFPWLFFSESMSRSVGILLENANLITKVVFPVELLPTGTVLSAFIINGVGFFLFLCYLIYNHYFHPIWGMIPVILLIQMLFTWGLAYLFASLCVFLRDIREILGIVLMTWFYATPVIYPASLVPEKFQFITAYNPMSLIIGCYRDILLVHQVNYIILLQAFCVSLFVYGIGACFFMRARPAFGDVL